MAALPQQIQEKIAAPAVKHIDNNAYPKVILAEIKDGLPVQVIGPRKTLKIGQVDAGREITDMRLHPQGLLVIRDGRKLLLSTANFNFVELE